MPFLRLGLHLTDRCSLDCSHCLRDPARLPQDLPLAVAIDVLDEAAARYGIRSVSLTGGEPALHPDFDGILDAIVSREMTWGVVTSGDRFERIERALRAAPRRRELCRSITFSIDGGEGTHDAIRGAGAYRRVMTAITRASAMGIPFGTQMTVHAGNAGEIDAVALAGARLGAQHLSFAMLQPTGTPADEHMFLPRAQWRALRRRIESLAEALRPTIVLAEGWPTDQTMLPCDALRGETLHVDVRGRLTLCCNLSGLPSDGDERDVAGDVADGLTGPHERLLGIVHEVMRGRLEITATRRGTAWPGFSCNTCLERFGRPHWTDDGVGGPAASRERWRGAWEKTPGHRLKVIA